MMGKNSNQQRAKTIVSSSLIIIGFILVVLSFGPLIKSEIWYLLKELRSQEYTVDISEEAVKDSVFARYLSTSPVTIEPVNKDFALVIEKIGVNAPVVADVTVTDKKAYNQALKDGIAHAITSKYPSENPGNVYLFAHSSVNFWQLGRYSNVFNLLRKMDIGDRIHVFYAGKDYVYETVNVEIYEGWNTYPLTRPVLEPLLTLQTCDPPGTTRDRLVVTARLIDVIE